MSDSEGEFDLLDPNHTVQTIGEHELKTSPLVTRDAIGMSEQFTQRGLLGTVLSVHAKGLPGRTVDPRIYLNLNAPSSGLVCGVQVRTFYSFPLWLKPYITRAPERVTLYRAF
jgi:hypothetical protein